MALISVPLAGQTLGSTRASVNSNFATINTAFLEDHVGYNDPGQGRHNRVSFPTQTVIPTPEAALVRLDSRLSTLTNQPELVYTRQAGSTAPSVIHSVEFTSAGWANPGWARLPSGILLKWGSNFGFGGSSILNLGINSNISFPNSPNFAAYFTAYLTTIDTQANYNNVIGIADYVSATKILTVAAMNGKIPPNSVTFAILIIGV